MYNYLFSLIVFKVKYRFYFNSTEALYTLKLARSMETESKFK